MSIQINQLNSQIGINSTDVIAKDLTTGGITKKTTMNQLGTYVQETLTNANLNTTSKLIVGSINELLSTFPDFLQKDGTVPLTANWDAGSFEIKADNLEVNDLTASRLLNGDASKKMASVTDFSTWFTSTGTTVVATDGGNGKVNLETHGSATSKWDEAGSVLFPKNLANDLAIGIGAANERVQIHNITAVDTLAQFTNLATGSGAGDGFKVGVLANGRGYIQSETRADVNVNSQSVGSLLSNGTLSWYYDVNVGSTKKFTCANNSLSVNSSLQEKTVGDDHCDYSTVAAALTAITDASSLKPYTLKLATKDWSAITMNKEFVNVDGEFASFNDKLLVGKNSYVHYGYSDGVTDSPAIYCNLAAALDESYVDVENMSLSTFLGVSSNQGRLIMRANKIGVDGTAVSGGSCYGYQLGDSAGIIIATTNYMSVSTNSANVTYGIYSRDGWQHHSFNTIYGNGTGTTIGLGGADDSHQLYAMGNYVGGDQGLKFDGGANFVIANYVRNVGAFKSEITGAGTHMLMLNYHEQDLDISAGATVYGMVNFSSGNITGAGTYVGLWGQKYYGDFIFKNNLSVHGGNYFTNSYFSGGYKVVTGGLYGFATQLDYGTGQITWWMSETTTVNSLLGARMKLYKDGQLELINNGVGAEPKMTLYGGSGGGCRWIGDVNAGSTFSGEMSISGGLIAFGRKAQATQAANGIFWMDVHNGGITRTKYRQQTVAGGTHNDLDGAQYSHFRGDTSSMNIIINGIKNGVIGDMKYIYKNNTNNTLTINHNNASAAVGDRILCPAAANMASTGYGLSCLAYNGNYWIASPLT